MPKLLDSLLSAQPKPIVLPMVAADFAARNAGRRLREVVTDGKLLAEVLLKAWREFGYDGIMVFGDTMVEAEALGCQVALPEDDNAYLAAPLGLEELERQAPSAKYQAPSTAPSTRHQATSRQRPARVLGRGRIPVILEAIRIVRQQAGAEVPVLGSLKGPFSLACFLVGVEEFMMRMRGDPATCLRVLKFALATQAAYCRAIVEAGGIPLVGDPLASGDLISRRDFYDFVLPYLRELIAQVSERPVALHICGDTSDRLEAMRDTGAEILSLDEIDLGQARRILGDDIVLMGNVPTQLIHQGSAEAVKTATRKCRAEAGPRLILSSACDIPRDAPAENVHALVEAGHEVR